MFKNKDKQSICFFLYGYYGFGNLGDDLLLKALILGIQARIPNAKFIVRSLNDGPKFSDDISVVYSKIDRIISDSSKSKLSRFLGYIKAYLNLCTKFDYLVIGGGTLIHDKKSSISLWILFIFSLLAKFFRKEIIVVGLGISELEHSNSYYILKLIIKMSRVFYVRDLSAKIITEKVENSQQKVQTTADLAYSLPFIKTKKIKHIGNKKVVGITLVDRANDIENEKFGEIICNYIINLLTLYKEEWSVYLIPFHQMDDKLVYCINDANLMKYIQKKVFTSTGFMVNVEYIDESFSRIDDIYSQIDLLIGMRFHSLVLAAIYEIPFVGIVHDNKLSDLCTIYKMPNFNISDLSFEDLLEITEKYSSLKIDSSINDVLINKSEQNFQIFKFLN